MIRERLRSRVGLFLVIAAAIALWAPRLGGPIDLRWDGGVYYLLGTSLAEGRGYRLLNEPGAIEAVQYPPLLPAVVAVHERVLGSQEPEVVGPWLRRSTFLVFVGFAVATWWLMRRYVPPSHALLGTLLTMLSLQAWFLSNQLYPELWFALTATLFLLCAGSKTRSGQAAAFVFAVFCYGFRTIGIVALAAWVLDSVFRRQLRQAAVRAALVAIPVIAWQGYVATVQRSEGYQQPAYAYQRAPYLFYNVSYATNIALRDPFTPEKGDVMVVRRIVRNLSDLPTSLGEALSIPRGYFEMALHAVVGDGPLRHRVIVALLITALSAFGVILIAGGTLLQLLRRDWIISLYIVMYVGALLVTPFPAQYLRYLMPVGSILALLSILFLRSVGASPWKWLGPAVALQIAVVAQVYTREFQTVHYSAHGHEQAWPLFFYSASSAGFDEAVDYLKATARSTDIVATGTPHWVYLRTGLISVMPPFEANATREQQLLDGVPVSYLIVGGDVIGSERYTAPVVNQFGSRWTPVMVTKQGGWTVYRREPNRDHAPTVDMARTQ